MPSKTLGNEHLLWEGSAQISAGSLEQQVTCRVILDDLPRRDLRIDVTSELDPITLFDNRLNFMISIPGIVDPIGLFLKETRTGLNGHNIVRFSVKRSPVWVSRTDQLKSGRAMLINFAHYGFEGQHQSTELHGAGWRLVLSTVSDEFLLANNLTPHGEYRVTHQITFSRDNGDTFQIKNAIDFLDNLQLFLSFCRGRWVTLIMTVILDEAGITGAEQWGIGRQTSWQDPSGWLDRHHPEPIAELFSPFFEKLSNELWKELLSQVVYWFSRAETDSAGVDGACVLLQTTLERFAWQVLVIEQKALSEKAFTRLTAADNLRLTLKLLGIPDQIPPGLSNLQQYAKPRRQDGPEAFTAIRNSIVHPTKPSSKEEKVPYYEAYLLAKWYLELAVLSVCAYKGSYNNRTLAIRWVGQVEKVPWVKSEESSTTTL